MKALKLTQNGILLVELDFLAGGGKRGIEPLLKRRAGLKD